jgi:hypothetical protein
MTGSHTIMYLFDWRRLGVGEGANAREGEVQTALQWVRQACPGICLEVRAIAL